MPYRPYPNADRARRQVARHAPPKGALPPWAEEFVRSFEPGAWHPDAIFDPATKRFLLWPAA